MSFFEEEFYARLFLFVIAKKCNKMRKVSEKHTKANANRKWKEGTFLGGKNTVYFKRGLRICTLGKQHKANSLLKYSKHFLDKNSNTKRTALTAGEKNCDSNATFIALFFTLFPLFFIRKYWFLPRKWRIERTVHTHGEHENSQQQWKSSKKKVNFW